MRELGYGAVSEVPICRFGRIHLTVALGEGASARELRPSVNFTSEQASSAKLEGGRVRADAPEWVTAASRRETPGANANTAASNRPPLRVAVDTSYDQDSQRAIRSVAKQQSECIGVSRRAAKADRAVDVELTFASWRGTVAAHAVEHFNAARWSEPNLDPRDVEDIFPRGESSEEASASGSGSGRVAHAPRLVYLSPDAEEVLEEVDADTVYIIGGIVDLAARVAWSLPKANAAGIRARASAHPGTPAEGDESDPQHRHGAQSAVREVLGEGVDGGARSGASRETTGRGDPRSHEQTLTAARRRGESSALRRARDDGLYGHARARVPSRSSGADSNECEATLFVLFVHIRRRRARILSYVEILRIRKSQRFWTLGACSLSFTPCASRASAFNPRLTASSFFASRVSLRRSRRSPPPPRRFRSPTQRQLCLSRLRQRRGARAYPPPPSVRVAPPRASPRAYRLQIRLGEPHASANRSVERSRSCAGPETSTSQHAPQLLT